jgi:hypothetical protein
MKKNAQIKKQKKLTPELTDDEKIEKSLYIGGVIGAIFGLSTYLYLILRN